MGRINAGWHEAHPMPEKPTLDQRVAWHLEHAAHCGCRGIPRLIAEELVRRGIPVPEPRKSSPGPSTSDD